MGIWRSLKGQVGRDTGKVISNFLWGDRHASVHRRAESRKREHMEWQLLESAEKQAKQEELNQLSDKVDDKIMLLVSLTASNDRDELVNTLASLAVLLKVNPIRDIIIAPTHRISNTYSDAILAKYEQVFVTFTTLYPHDSMVSYYADILKSANKLRFLKRYMLIYIGAVCLLMIIILINVSD